MPTTKTPVAKKKASKARSVGRPKKASPTLVLKTLITIHPDGIITIEKTEETVTEQVLKKAEVT